MQGLDSEATANKGTYIRCLGRFSGKTFKAKPSEAAEIKLFDFS